MNSTIRPNSLTTIIQGVCENTSGEKICFGDIVELFGMRSFGPMLFLPGAILATPVGAIPGMPAVAGIIILFLSAQLLIGHRKPWIPSRVLRYSFSREKFVKVAEVITPYTRRIDKFLKPRLRTLSTPPYSRIPALVSLLMAVLIFPLSIIPFGVFVPGLAVALIGLGLALRDGIVMVLGLAIAGATLGFGIAQAYFLLT